MKRAELSEKDTWSRSEGEDARVRWKTYPGRLHNNGRHAWSISVEVSRKINGSEQGRGGWVIYLRARGAAAGGNVSNVKGFETEEERWRSWRGCFILKGVKKKKRCSNRDDWETMKKKKRRLVFSLTCLTVTACDGGGVTCQADDGSWAALTIKTCLSAQPLSAFFER